MWKVTRKGLVAHKLRFVLTGDRGDPRRRVHVGHVRVHRDDPADVRRPVRQHLQGHRRGGARPGGVQERLRLRATRRERPVPARSSRSSRSAPGVAGRATATCRSTTRSSSTRTARRSATRAGRAHARLRLEPDPELNQFHLVRAATAARPTTRSSSTRAAPTRRNFQVGDEVDGAHRPCRRRSTRSSASRSSAPPTASRARRSCCSRMPEAQRIAGAVGQFDHISIVGKPGVSQEQVAAEHRARRSRDTARQVEVVTGEGAHQGEPEPDRQGARLPQHRPAASSRSSRSIVGAFIIYNTFSIVVAQRTREMALLRAIGASTRQVLASVIGESVVVGVVASRDRRRRPASALAIGLQGAS